MVASGNPDERPRSSLVGRRAAPDEAGAFRLDPRIVAPSGFRVAFVILLDGDLVMSPEHLGVASMTAVLRRAGFTVRIFEVDIAGRGAEEAARWEPHLVCFTLMSINVPSCLRTAEELERALPRALFVCGGPAATYATEDILRHNPYIDVAVVGEGEATIMELVQKVVLGADLTEVRGLVVRTPEGAVARTPPRPLLHDLDALPFPARDQFEQHGKLEYVRVSTSRGCVARCTFCSAPNITNRVQPGKAWRARSVESVLEEVSQFVSRYGFRTFDFVDSTFEDPDGGPIGKGRLRRLIDGLAERNLEIYYNCCMRAENWSDADRDLLDRLVMSGMEKVNVGIEAGNESDLRLWDKLATVEDNARVIRLLREHGVYLSMGFIQFHPYATIDTLVANAKFLREHSGHNLRRLTERLEIYPGTVIVSRLEKDGLLDETYFDDLNHYGYRYRDECVARLATHFASLYNDEDYHRTGRIAKESAVFRFEVFNVIVETFVSRCRRRFGALPGALEVIRSFQEQLHAIRLEMSERNFEFFMDNLESVLADRLDMEHQTRQVGEINDYFAAQMSKISNLQLRLGRHLSRCGANIREISSSLEQFPPATGKVYTGGAPCW